jgi:hypothetical protein
MPRHLQPTVRQLLPIRQVLAGAAIAGAIAVAVPATASAADSKCEYNASNKNVLIDDFSGPNPLRIVRVGDVIGFSDGPGALRFCTIPGQNAVATVHNTERVAIFRSGPNLSGGVHVDLSGGALAPGATPEADGQSEVEVQIADTGVVAPLDFTDDLRITGTPQADVIAASRNSHVNFGTDSDTDVLAFRPLGETMVDGGEGDDILRAIAPPVPLSTGSVDLLRLDGDGGSDIVAGSQDRERLLGGNGNDRLADVDTNVDSVFGDEPGATQPGLDDSAIVDIKNFVDGVERKFISSGGIGKLALKATPGKVTRMLMSWTHPKA